jgi:glycosidase
MKKSISIMLLIFFIASCATPVTTTNPPMVTQPGMTSTPSQTQVHPWWKSAVFYEIFVRSFYDSNGDGIGDFNGVTQKLDYLQQLGVNALWLMPIYPSPSYHGYDVMNYFNVNPDYGTMRDFQKLLSAAHQRGMHVILDLELNHTSSQNPWFTNSNSDTQSPYRDWYIWSDTDPGYIGPIGIAWHPGQHGFYYGIFNDSMPDLNYKNPAVTAEMDKVVAFWLNDVGVDGFRLDAINYLIEEGEKQINTVSTHDWLRDFYKTYKADNSQAFTIGEVYNADASLAKTYTGDQMDMVFNFEFASSILNSAKGGSNSAIDSALTFAKQSLPSWDFGTFLTNHDQNRVMSTLSGNIDQAKISAFLLLTSPGVPFIYYGEEIGMQGEKPDEDIRLPMQWTSAQNAGFTSGSPWMAPNTDYLTVNVEAEKNDKDSLLNYYSELIAIRKQSSVLANGNLLILQTKNTGVFAALRSEDNETLLVLANLTANKITDYSLGGNQTGLSDGKYKCTDLLTKAACQEFDSQNLTIQGYQPITTLEPYTGYVLEFKK